jgi:hypothetical protein
MFIRHPDGGIRTEVMVNRKQVRDTHNIHVTDDLLKGKTINAMVYGGEVVVGFTDCHEFTFNPESSTVSYGYVDSDGDYLWVTIFGPPSPALVLDRP